jgi:serine/threonine protein kinase
MGAFTPAYASYEQLRGEDPDPRDDIYALGCVTYELLTGKHPFGRLPADKALELKLQPQPIPKLGRKPWKGLQRALAIRKEDRTPSTEVFIADLSPRSPWFLGLTAALFMVAGLTATNVYLGMRQPDAPAKPPLHVELDAAQKQKVADLLELAATHFDVGFYTAPTGSNALWAYQEVLKIDPYNEAAIAGIRKITDTLEQEAWEAYEKGDRKASMKKVMEGLEVNPKHPGLMQLKTKLLG